MSHDFFSRSFEDIGIDTLDTALGLLPKKSAIPVRQLLKNDLVTKEIVVACLKALHQSSSDPSHLLAFVVAYQFLQSRDVSVDDTVTMARQMGHQVNLAWSERRWKEEHDLLSRMATLHSLAEENYHYDLSEYRAHLPNLTGGYLIPSSRRLGMEGLRQRHCVASYHQRIKAGLLVIASVFAKGCRWTLELKIDSCPAVDQTPIRITQIKGKRNRNPTSEERAAIFKVVGIPDLPMSSPLMTSVRPTSESVNARIIECFDVLERAEVTKAIASFSGGGDSGYFDGVSFYDRQGLAIQSVPNVGDVSVHEAIDQLMEDYLQLGDYDICNNDGGNFELIFDVQNRHVVVDITGNYMHCETLEYVEHSYDDLAAGMSLQ